MLVLCLVLCFGWFALRMTGTEGKRTCMRGVMKEGLGAIWPWEEQILGE